MLPNYTIHQGDNRDTLKTLEDNSVDAIVTDPPYGIDFLGKDWDANTGALETYKECLRVLKPGGYILAFSAARTYHHLAITLEQAGFEIRDQIMWLYASGFPKAIDIGKAIDKRGIDNEWKGWKTQLKPAHEPIAMARKPFKGSNMDNVLAHGVGALNIDASRIAFEDPKDIKTYKNNIAGPLERSTAKQGDNIKMHQGQTGFKVQKGNADDYMVGARYPSNVLGEVEGYQKYFYCPKVSGKERHTGTDNNHPTVKPVALMRYLIKLVTPPNSTVLDPFTGSGSTGMAATELGHTFIGCELDPAYVQIAKKRIEAWNTPECDNNYEALFDEEDI